MSRSSLVLLVLAILLAGGGTVLFRTAPEPELREAVGEAPLAVGTLVLRAETVRPRSALSGLLEARRSVGLYAEGSGRVLAVGAEALDDVEADQLLMQIDPVTADVGVLRAEATLARAESELSLARATLKRQEELRGNAVTSVQSFEEAENRERIALASEREARAVVREARDQLAKRTLRAAFAGVLLVFSVEKGEYLQVGQPIGELLDVASVRVTVGLSDRDVVFVKAGERVQVEVEAHPGEVFEGTVLRVGGAADPDSRKFSVQIEIPNPDRRLLPGMVARVTLELGDARPRTAVPREAVLEEYGIRYAFAVEESGGEGDRAHRRVLQVRDIPFRPDQLEVVEGLSAGDEIVVTGVRQVRDGARIERIEGR